MELSAAMQYFGGKYRIARRIVDFLPIHSGTDYVEPFVGGGNVLARIEDCGSRYASDANAALISMWCAIQNGWIPPETVTEDDYARARTLPDSDPFKAFAGFGCSFAGKWFGGYARNSKGDNYARRSRSSLIKTAPLISDVAFVHCDYVDSIYPSGSIVYCDPPYQGTTQYGAVEKFNWSAFWSFFSYLSQSCFVFVSEYQAPDDWTCALSISTRTAIRTSKNGCESRTERLWCHRDGLAGACL